MSDLNRTGPSNYHEVNSPHKPLTTEIQRDSLSDGEREIVGKQLESLLEDENYTVAARSILSKLIEYKYNRHLNDQNMEVNNIRLLNEIASIVQNMAINSLDPIEFTDKLKHFVSFSGGLFKYGLPPLFENLLNKNVHILADTCQANSSMWAYYEWHTDLGKPEKIRSTALKLLHEWKNSKSNIGNCDVYSAVNRILECIQDNTKEGLDLSELKLRSLPHPLVFSQLRHLKRLDLSNNCFLKSRDYNTLFPNSAVRSGNLPVAIRELVNLEVLNLNDYSSIYSVDECRLSAFFSTMPKLQELHLSNFATMIDENSFGSLPNLRVLNLSKCNRVSINPNFCEKFPKLEDLRLRKCELIGLHPGGFANLKNLKVLDLKQAIGLEKCTGGELQGLSRLEWLNLAGCKLYDRSLKLLQDLPNLRSLDLSGNSNICHLDQVYFKNLPRLETLNLTNCKITDLKNVTFNGLSNLDKLNLCGNPIATIEDNAFEGLTKLRELFLANCRLSEIKNEYWKGLPNLNLLDLSGNKKLRSLEDDQFKGLDCLSRLYLRDSNLQTLRLGSLNESDISNLDNLKILEFYNADKEIDEISIQNLSALRQLKLNSLQAKQARVYNLPNLSELDLDNSIVNLQQLMDGGFLKLNSLKKLVLSRCEINQLKFYAFSELSQLEELDLSYNLIKQVLADDLSGLNNLKNIKFKGCRLEYFDKLVLNNLQQLELLDISYNRNLQAEGFALENNPSLEVISFGTKGTNLNSIINKYLQEAGYDISLLKRQWNTSTKSSINLDSFTSFMERLDEIKDFCEVTSATVRQEAVAILAQIILAIDKNDEIFKDCCNIATSCLGDCGDAIHFGFLRMQLVATKLDYTNDKISTLFANQRKTETMEKVIKIAADKVKKLQKDLLHDTNLKQK